MISKNIICFFLVCYEENVLIKKKSVEGDYKDLWIDSVNFIFTSPFVLYFYY